MTTHTNAHAFACDCPSCSDGTGRPQSHPACPTPCPGHKNAPAARTGDVAGCPEASPVDFAALGAEIGRLVETKQRAYGLSFSKAGRVLLELYPAGIPPEKLDDALTIVRVVDKLFRIATDRDALGESPWRDIAGYALLSVARVEGERAAKPRADVAEREVP